MKTVSGHCVLLKETSVSKAAKVLSKFVFTENGASPVISAYINRASASFNELHQLQKGLKSLHSCKNKYKRRQVETGGGESKRIVDDENSVCKNADQDDDEKSTVTIAKFSQEELNGCVGQQVGNVGGSGRHKGNRKK
ncbi:hypothetical protein RJT34_16739 [Clitoria ternatea]|uniref:Uncharacterized protein n=1 Tax=Clitoria ternatea TaxID=43366 RepID=A0AAN9J7N1_CLITE